MGDTSDDNIFTKSTFKGIPSYRDYRKNPITSNSDFMKKTPLINSTGYDEIKMDLGDTSSVIPEEIAVRVPSVIDSYSSSSQGLGGDWMNSFKGLFTSPTLEKGQAQGLSPFAQGLGAVKDVFGIYSDFKGIGAQEDMVDTAKQELALKRMSFNDARAEQARQVSKEQDYQDKINKVYGNIG